MEMSVAVLVIHSNLLVINRILQQKNRCGLVKEGGMREKMEEEERVEAVIAATPSLQPNFKSVGVTEDQLNKFQELHQRRLQIKAKSKKKFKGNSTNAAKASGKDLRTKDIKKEDTSIKIGESGLRCSRDDTDSSPLQHDKGTSPAPAPAPAPKNRQKLHWGLDTKERWERKANM